MGSASTRVLITTPISGNMKHHCSPSFFLILIGILSLLVSASATSNRGGGNEIVSSSNIEAKVAGGDMHQIVQREAEPRGKRRKGKVARRQGGKSKKCKNGRNSCKKKTKSKKQERGGR